MDESSTLDRVTDAGLAWGEKTPAKIVEYLTEDAVLCLNLGADGLPITITGKEAIREHVESYIANNPDLQITNLRARLSEGFGVWEWDVILEDDQGHKTVLPGCDILTIVGDKIAMKTTFTK